MSVITVGCAIYALSFNWFFQPNNISMGGFTGIAQIIKVVRGQIGDAGHHISLHRHQIMAVADPDGVQTGWYSPGLLADYWDMREYLDDPSGMGPALYHSAPQRIAIAHSDPLTALWTRRLLLGLWSRGIPFFIRR